MCSPCFLKSRRRSRRKSSNSGSSAISSSCMEASALLRGLVGIISITAAIGDGPLVNHRKGGGGVALR